MLPERFRVSKGKCIIGERYSSDKQVSKKKVNRKQELFHRKYTKSSFLLIKSVSLSHQVKSSRPSAERRLHIRKGWRTKLSEDGGQEGSEKV